MSAQVTLNSSLSFLGDFAASIVRTFFRLWKRNRALPVELLFSKQRSPQTFASCLAPPGVSENETAAADEEAEEGSTEGKENSLLRLTPDGGLTQHDFWSPASLPALRSLCSNYALGSDAKVLDQMKMRPLLEPEEALKAAADEAAATAGGNSASQGWAGRPWSHEEDCMLMQYFEQFRGVRDYYAYIAGKLLSSCSRGQGEGAFSTL